MKRLSVFSLLILFASALSAQIINPVQWTFETKNVNPDQVDLIFKATISRPWHMYGLNINEGGPVPFSISFKNTSGFELVEKPRQSPKPGIVYDEIFGMKVELHSDKATITQRIRKISNDSILVIGTLNYQTCSDMQCVLGDAAFKFKFGGKPGNVDAGISSLNTDSDTVNYDSNRAAAQNNIEQPVISTPSAPKKSLWKVFFISLLLGLGGLATPCVYPMIPLTVSYFLRGPKTRSKAISEALVFGLSIVFLYTLIGVIVALLKNPNAINNVTTHWITNLVFFLVFLALSASFFGMFEIMLPSGIGNKLDQKADQGGYTGPFFMALAMAVLSFSCTGPIIAGLLIQASQGDVLEPVIGMAGFAITFAMPFTLFAIFPSGLKMLPKSGGWMNSIKVFFAFIMLAFALYFLAKIDQAYHLRLLSRELFLSIWIVIFILLGFYLLGKIRFENDAPAEHTGFPRFLLSVISFSFALYLFTGILGNPLKPFSTILPPEGKDQKTSMIAVGQPSALCSVPSFNDLPLPNALEGYFVFEEALACAKEKNKPVLVDFVGHTCANCKKMYAEVFSDPRVLTLLQQKFILVALYTDDKTPLSVIETDSLSGTKIKTLGKKNQMLQIHKFNSNALPLYAVVDGEGNTLSQGYYTYDPDPEKFIRWLESALKKQ
jgi:thiol:disulfide interchange protein